jgi:hypothetical protein
MHRGEPSFQNEKGQVRVEAEADKGRVKYSMAWPSSVTQSIFRQPRLVLLVQLLPFKPFCSVIVLSPLLNFGL